MTDLTEVVTRGLTEHYQNAGGVHHMVRLLNESFVTIPRGELPEVFVGGGGYSIGRHTISTGVVRSSWEARSEALVYLALDEHLLQKEAERAKAAALIEDDVAQIADALEDELESFRLGDSLNYRDLAEVLVERGIRATKEG